MKKLIVLASLVLSVGTMTFAGSAGAVAGPFAFGIPRVITPATIGVKYPGYNFSRSPFHGVCGGPFDRHTTNPRGGGAGVQYTFRVEKNLGAYNPLGFKPVGLTLNFRTGALSGTVYPSSRPGTYTFRVCASTTGNPVATPRDGQERNNTICQTTSIVVKPKPTVTTTTTTTTAPPPIDVVSPTTFSLGSVGGCSGGTITAPIQITAASNVSWIVSADPNNNFGQVVAGNGTGSGPFTVTINVAPQTPTFNCTYTIPMSESTFVDVRFSDGTILGVTVNLTYIFVE